MAGSSLGGAVNSIKTLLVLNSIKELNNSKGNPKRIVMKSLFFLKLFLTLSAFAAADCTRYEIKGRIQNRDGMKLIVNEGTLSEISLPIQIEQYERFAPYLNSMTIGTYILKGPIKTGQNIESISSLKIGVPDPLNHMNHSYVKALECPK